MSFFISDALADAAPAAAPTAGDLTGLLLPFAVLVIFYFIMIRPQAKRQKEQKAMVEALAKGDEVQTEGGIMGKITKIGDNFILLEVSDGVSIKVRRTSVAVVMPKGTLKEL